MPGSAARRPPAAPHLLQRQGGGGPDAVEQRQPGQVSQQPLVALQRVRVARVLLRGGLLLLPVTQAALREHQGQALQADTRWSRGHHSLRATREGRFPAEVWCARSALAWGGRGAGRLPWKTAASASGNTAGGH